MKKPQKIINRIGEELFIGDKVICRGNEPTPLIIGKIIDFSNLGLENSEYLLVVKGLYNNKVVTVFGIVRLYNNKIINALYYLNPIEQYNYLLVQQGMADRQIKTKYGVKYRTFSEEEAPPFR